MEKDMVKSDRIVLRGQDLCVSRTRLEHSYTDSCALGTFSNVNIKSPQVPMHQAHPKLVVAFGDMVETLGDRTSLTKLGH